jgi:glycosyltransferase involved in cell wall biosynthesis
MRLIVDGRPLVGERTGIGVHVAEILRRLDLGERPVVASHRPIENVDGLDQCEFAVDRAPLGVLWQQFLLNAECAMVGADVLWGPHGTLPWNVRIPAVVSMHDLTSLTMPGAHRLKTIVSFNAFIGRSLDAAKKIAAVSVTTADEVVRRFAIARSKVEVVPNGVSDFFRPTGAAREDFILYLGTREPRKGIGDLLDAWRSLPAPRPRLVLAGSAGWKVGEIEDAVVLGYVSRERVRDLFSRCKVFVYPSRYEGFGLPPLEAMACGAPVVAARGGAIPEVLGDAALLVAPGEPRELAIALRRVLGDASLREDLSAAGQARAAMFSWDRSAALFGELLRRAGV